MKLTDLKGIDALTEIERQLNELRERIDKLENKKIAVAEKNLKHFDAFWDAYPRKKSKGDAQKAWAKINPNKELVDKMLWVIKIARRSEDWCKDKGVFIPYPASWLNAKGWEDEYKAMAAPPPEVVAPRPEAAKIDETQIERERLWASLPEQTKQDLKQKALAWLEKNEQAFMKWSNQAIRTLRIDAKAKEMM